MTNYDVVVVGSGVIGLCTSWQLAAGGRRVALIDPRPGRGASYAAAGLLAPVTEASWGEEELIELNLRSARAWLEFAREVEAASDLRIDFQRSGTLLVGADPSDRDYLGEILDFLQHLGLTASWCPPSRCRELEPLLVPGVRGGIEAPGDHQVDNRRLLGALGAAGARAGVSVIRERVDEVLIEAGAVTGVRVGESELRAPIVIVAAGHASGSIAGIPDEFRPAVRPVKGQILRLRTRSDTPLSSRAVRAVTRGHAVYVVPRSDGRVVVGATVEELGTDTTVTVEACYELLRDAIAVLPILGELELVEAIAGLRPGSPDNAPLIGASGIDGLIVATGHYRNGILLAPVTVQALLTLVETGDVPEWARPFSPNRSLGVTAAANR